MADLVEPAMFFFRDQDIPRHAHEVMGNMSCT